MTVPYHLVNLFVRAALAESVALAFLPLVLWAFREAVVRPRLRSVIAAGFAFAAVMWTSNLVALVFAPGLAAYVLALILLEVRERRAAAPERVAFWQAFWSRETLRTILAPGLGLALGLGLSVAFFVPALVEQAYINRTQWFGAYYNPEQHFVYFHQLFDPRWGFGISQPGPDDAAQGSLSYQLGAVATLFSLIALALSGRFRPRLRGELRFWGLWLVVAVFLTLPVSVLLWRYVPIVGYAQFPWRYLMLAIIPLSILPSALTSVAGKHVIAGGHPLRGLQSLFPAVVVSLLLLLSSAPYIRVEMREPTVEQGPVSMAALMRFQRTSDEMTGVTAWVDPARRPIWSDLAELWVQGMPVNTRVDYSQVPQTETLAINSEDVGAEHEQIFYYAKDAGQTVTFNRFWYPGWTAWLLDGKNGRPVSKLEIQRENGPLARVVVPIPQGQGYILLRFEDTPLRRVSKWVTAAVILGLVLIIVAVAWIRRRNSRRIA
jgi:hypothetical protein